MARTRKSKVLGSKIDDIVCHLEFLLRKMRPILAEMDEEPRNCGYFSVLSREDGRVLLFVQIGNCPADKVAEYSKFALEKGLRLFYSALYKHKSSWQSRDEDQQKYGGAICAGKFILSFSGLSELADEALMLVLAHNLLLIGPRTCQHIVRVSDNQFFKRLVPQSG